MKTSELFTAMDEKFAAKQEVLAQRDANQIRSKELAPTVINALLGAGDYEKNNDLYLQVSALIENGKPMKAAIWITIRNHYKGTENDNTIGMVSRMACRSLL